MCEQAVHACERGSACASGSADGVAGCSWAQGGELAGHSACAPSFPLVFLSLMERSTGRQLSGMWLEASCMQVIHECIPSGNLKAYLVDTEC